MSRAGRAAHALAGRSIVDACLRLERDGLVVGTYGNVSHRVPEGLLVTPSRVAYDQLTPDALVLLDLDGRRIDGEGVPSSESSVHRRIYRQRPDVMAIVHAHPLHATAASCLGAALPCIVEEQAQVLGGDVPCAAYVPAGQHEALGRAVAAAIGAANAVLLANHGLVTVGASMAAALFATIVAERVATMHLLVSVGGRTPVPMDARHVAAERVRYATTYGTPADADSAGVSEDT